MAKKQLNLDMPLLSVRRLPSKLSSSSSSDERKSSSNPRSSTGQSSVSNLYTPESDLTQFSKPAAVPFLWEQIPGRPKEEPDAKSECPVESWRCTPPRLPPGRIRRSGELFDEKRLLKSQVSASFSYDLSALEMENESIQDIYCDALETLSQTESLSFDCRFVRSTKTSLTDSQTRDFMMRRFLPAAKAMVIDAPPQYVSQKHSGQQLDQKNKIDEERISLIKQNQQVKDSETDEEDDDDDDGDDCVDAIKKPAKIRGLFAKFCLRNSLCLLNPSSGMKSKKKHVPASSSPAPAKEVVSRMSRSSYSGPLPRLNNPPGSKLPASGNRKSFSGELLRNQSMFRGVPKIVRKTTTTTPSSFEKMYGLDHHPLSITRSSHELEKKKSNVCYPANEIEEEMFCQDYTINIKDSFAVGNVDNGKSQSQNQLGSSGGKVDHDEGRKSSSKEIQDESIMNCSPLTPPLPKSPSESWLWRAIPSISLKSPFQPHTKKQNGRVSTSSPNWETIVKTSNKHRDHVRYSEELIPRISQHSKA